MHNPMLRSKKPASWKTMELQKRLLRELSTQDITVGQVAWFFNYVMFRKKK